MLPSILKRAMILAAVCLMAAGMIAFCAGVLNRDDSGDYKLKIGYVAEDDRITKLAVSYVQNMESVKSLCCLEAVTEQEGRQLLQEGELSALIVLPQDVINEILSGSNTPAVLYFPEKQGSAVSGMLFEELASAGIGMLGTAQAEIYAADAIVQELSGMQESESLENGLLQAMYDDINRFNLQVVTGREKLFRKKTLSLTENDTYAVYYGSALATVYVMLAGLFFGEFCKRSNMQQLMTDRRVGVSYTVQLATRCLAGGMLMFFVLLLPCLLLTVLQMTSQAERLLTIRLTWQGFISLLLITAVMTIYDMLIYQIVEKRASALVVLGILALLQSYMAGCLIPSVLLPDAVALMGKFLPAAMVKKGFTILFTGDTQSIMDVAAGLCVWSLCLFCGTVLSMHIGERNRLSENSGRQSEGRFHVPSLGMVMFRRLLHKKSMWISLGLLVLLSAVIIRTEKSSQTQIKAAVYDASGEYGKLLCAYDGIVDFELYESDAAVLRAVQKGDVECGYVLPEKLCDDMMAMRADRGILVYQDADAVAEPVVNEILFERFFRQVSLKWFEDYILQNRVIAGLGMDDKQLRQIVEECAGATFGFEIRRPGAQEMEMPTDGSDKDGVNRTVYPIYVVAAVAVVLCALQGIVQVLTDVRAHNFYKQNRVAASVLTLMLPVMLGVVCAGLLILIGALSS